MSDSRSELVVVVNPWQANTLAVTYSVVSDVAKLPILIWDPSPMESYIKLKSLPSQIRDVAPELEGLLPIDSSELLEKIEKRLTSLRHAFTEQVEFLSQLRPRRLLVLTELPPTDMFWQAVPDDASTCVIGWSHRRETMERIMEDSPALKRFEDAVKWVQSPLDLFICIWEVLNQQPFPKKLEVIFTDSTPEGILTGMYYAKREGIPLLVGQIIGEELQSQAFRIAVERKKDISGKPIRKFETIRKAKLCDIPRFNCVLESVSNVAFVATIMHAFEQEGQVVLTQVPSTEAVGEAEFRMKCISDLMLSGLKNQANRELQDLSRLVTDQIPQNVSDTLGEFSEIPVQIVGTPFPYSLCRTSNGIQYWAEVYKLAFLPLFQATNVFLRNIEISVRKSEEICDISLCALIDSLSSYVKTETEFVAANLQSKKSYCITLKEESADVGIVKSVLNYLPLDVCLFVAHGTENGLVLADKVLSSDEICTLRLQGKPFIINNSCQSWTEAGTAFVKAGARGFIGTYWTVENVAALNIAQNLTGQLLKGRPASHALQEVIQHGFQSLTHLAYIFVGLHDTKLPVRQPSDLDELRIQGWARILREAGYAALIEDDPISASALRQFVPPLEEINIETLSPSLASEIVLSHFNFLLGMESFGKSVTDDAIVTEGISVVAFIRQRGTDVQLHRALSHLGKAYVIRNSNGDLKQAEKCFSEALEIEQRLGKRLAEARDLGNLGVVYQGQGNYLKAIEYHQRALSINKETGNSRDWVMDVSNIALCYLSMNDMSSGLEYAREALRLHDAVIEFRTEKLEFCFGVAERLAGVNQCIKALEFIDIIFGELFRKMRNKEQKLTETEVSLMIHGTNLRGRCLENRGLFKEAEKAYLESAKVAMSLGKLDLYFSTECERIRLLNKAHKFKAAHVLASELSVKLEQLKDHIDRQMYEEISRITLMLRIPCFLIYFLSSGYDFAYQITGKNLDSDIFEKFVSFLIEKFRKIVIVTDQAKYHTSYRIWSGYGHF